MSKPRFRGNLQLWKYAVRVFEGNIHASEDNTHHLKMIFQLFIIDNKAVQFSSENARRIKLVDWLRTHWTNLLSLFFRIETVLQ